MSNESNKPFITPDRNLATYLFKKGYDNYEITEQDGVKVFVFTIPTSLLHTLKKDIKQFGT